MSSLPALLAALLLVNPRSSAEVSVRAASITVMPFAARNGESQSWLGKGLSDLIIRHLAEVPSLSVLERERMQAILNELELGKAPLFDQEQALRLGRVAKVKEAVYGNYEVVGDDIAISAFWIDLETQKVLTTAEASGSRRRLVDLTRDLTERLLEKRGSPLTKSDRARLQIRVTDSIGALEHFYRGVDCYDLGNYPDAWGEFFSAAQQDPRFADAWLWSGRMLEAQGLWEQALIGYRDVTRRFPSSVEGADAHLFGAIILEEKLNRPDQAAAEYGRLADSQLKMPHRLIASYRLGRLLESRKQWRQAYGRLGALNSFRESLEKYPLRFLLAGALNSRFWTWNMVRDLDQDAIVRRINIYSAMVETEERSHLPPPPRGVFLLDESRPIVFEPRFRQTPSMFFARTSRDDWQEATYAVIAPKGKVMSGMDMTLTGRLLKPLMTRDFTLRVLPFPLPRDYQQAWLGTIYGQTPDLTTLHKYLSFHGESRKIVTVQAIESMGRIESWAIKARLTAARPKTPEFHGSTDATPYEGQLIEEILRPETSLTGSSRDITQTFVRPQKDMTVVDAGGEIILVTAEGELDGENTDLWMSSRKHGKSFSDFKRLPVNSAAHDYDPKLVAAEDGSVRLSWISNRRGRGWELWVSRRDADENWEAPQRVPLERFAATNMEAIADAPEKLLEYDFIQDRRGVFWIAVYSRGSKELVFLTSRDMSHWDVRSHVPCPDGCYGLSLFQDHSERYLLSCVNDRGMVRIGSSNDGMGWGFIAGPGFGANPESHRTYILETASLGHVVLMSNKGLGPRFAAFRPGQNSDEAQPIVRTRLESVAPTTLSDGAFALAAKQSDRISVRRYRHFQVAAGNRKSHETPSGVFQEIEQDEEGNTWTRSFPAMRFKMPDVTAVAVESRRKGESDPVVWFGVETGTFRHQGEDFRMADVTRGFFNNDATEMLGCPGTPVYFASRNLDKPVISMTAGSDLSFKTESIPAAHGAITGLACGQRPNEIYVDTAAGETWKGDGRGWSKAAFSLGPRARKNALIKRLGQGLYSSVGPIVEDSQHGIWYLPDNDSPSRGLGYFDGRSHTLYNPPHAILDRPSGLALDADGNVWIGTWFKGLYKLERKK